MSAASTEPTSTEAPDTDPAAAGAVAALVATAQNTVREASQTPLDRAISAARGRPTPVAPSLRSGVEPMLRPSPAFDARVIAALPDYDEETRPYVGLAETALDQCRISLERVIAARQGSLMRPDWNEAMQVLNVAVEADKHSKAATDALTKAHHGLTQSIKQTEDMLRTPINTGANTPVAVEIRAYMRGLKSEERGKAMHAAVQKGDMTTLSAVLGGPAYLSGLSDEMQGEYLRQHHLVRDPAAAKRLALMRAALEKVEAINVAMWQSSVEQAMGVRMTTVQRLRGQRDAAERKFNGA